VIEQKITKLIDHSHEFFDVKEKKHTIGDITCRSRRQSQQC